MTFRTATAVASALAATALLAAASAANAAPVAFQVRGSDGKPLEQAVIAVTVKGTKPQAPAGASTEISQRERQFVPMLRVIQTGTAVQFPNFDTVRHHVYSVAPVKRFELKLYVGTPAEPVVFDKPGIAVLGCNIHDRMRAWVIVVDTPHFASTPADGKAVLDLPPGEHRLRAWHPAMAENAAWVELPLIVAASSQAMSVTLPVSAASAEAVARADR